MQDWTRLQWQVRSYFDVWTELLERAPRGRPLVVGIDGHSGSGKTTLADALASVEPHTAVIHTDDVAWQHSFFDWNDLVIEHLLQPIHQGHVPVSYRPPGWIEHGREGEIFIAPTVTAVLVEGVGVASREVRPWLDTVIWVHVRCEVGRQRLVAKGDTDAFINDWMSQEDAFLDDHRPWEAADLLVAGELGQPAHNGRYGNVVTAQGPGRAT